MATYTAPTTRASGYLVTAANWNTDIVENIKYFKDAPTFDGAVTASSTLTAANNVGLAATKKLYLDGVALTGDTYISESSANVLSLFSGGVEAKLTSGLLTVSGAGFNYFSAGTNAQQAVVVTNTTNGTAATALLRVQTTAGTANYGTLQAYSSGYTTSTVDIASSVLLQSEGSGGLSLAANNASGAIRFYSGGSTERWSMSTAGHLWPGSAEAYNIGSAALPVNNIYSRGTYNTSTASAANMFVASDGLLYRSTSARRYKQDEQPFTGGLHELLQLRPVTYEERGRPGPRFVGFIADDSAAATPLVVSYGADGQVEGYQYDRLTTYIVNAFKEIYSGWQQHDATIQSLAARIAALESK